MSKQHVDDIELDQAGTRCIGPHSFTYDAMKENEVGRFGNQGPLIGSDAKNMGANLLGNF